MNTYSSWEDVPDNLKTRTALKKLGLKPKRGAKPAGIKTHWHWKTPDYDLYSTSDCEPLIVSEKQRAALEKAQQKSLESRTCKRCGWVQELSRHYRGKWYIQGGLCPQCLENQEREDDEQEVVYWAQGMLDEGFVILDTETTGLGWGVEIVEIAVIDHTGAVLLNSLCKPVDYAESNGATAIHGITPEMVADAPSFADLYPVLYQTVRGRHVVIYNASYDTDVLLFCSQLYHLPDVFADPDSVHCAMLWYAQWYGDWSSYHGNYKWQKLNGGHRALDDCQAVLRRIQHMAEVEHENAT